MNGVQGAEQSSKLGDIEIGKIDGWTKNEKYELLQCLKNVGSHDLNVIQNYIPGKSFDQIKSAIEYYKSKALSNKSKRGGRPKLDCNVKPGLPLTDWAKLLTDSIEFNDLQTEIATALRLIADFEDVPHAVCTDHIDFRRAYHIIADAVEGKPLQEDDLLPLIITKSIVETALASKVFIQPLALKRVMDSINIKEKSLKDFLKPNMDKELALIQHLAQQRNYNPLNIPEQNLRATSE